MREIGFIRKSDPAEKGVSQQIFKPHAEHSRIHEHDSLYYVTYIANGSGFPNTGQKLAPHTLYGKHHQGWKQNPPPSISNFMQSQTDFPRTKCKMFLLFKNINVPILQLQFSSCVFRSFNPFVFFRIAIPNMYCSSELYLFQMILIQHTEFLKLVP